MAEMRKGGEWTGQRGSSMRIKGTKLWRTGNENRKGKSCRAQIDGLDPPASKVDLYCTLALQCAADGRGRQACWLFSFDS